MAKLFKETLSADSDAEKMDHLTRQVNLMTEQMKCARVRGIAFVTDGTYVKVGVLADDVPGGEVFLFKSAMEAMQRCMDSMKEMSLTSPPVADL